MPAQMFSSSPTGGAESMSRGQYWVPGLRWGQRLNDGAVVDATVGALYGEAVRGARFVVSMVSDDEATRQVMLGTPAGTRNGPAFLVGWIVGIAVVVSWLVSGLFTPYLAVKMLPKDLGKHHDGGDPYQTPRYRRLRGWIDEFGAESIALARSLDREQDAAPLTR